MAKHWTLEYEIAKSGLYKELAMAISLAKGEQAGKELTQEDAKTEVEKDYKDSTNDAVAYEIFKPINDKTVSKAIVAQHLATLIESDAQKYKAIFETDENLKYLVEAIQYVTSEK